MGHDNRKRSDQRNNSFNILLLLHKIYKTLKENTQNLNAHSIEDAAASSRCPATDIRLLKTSFTVVCVFLVTWGPVTAVVRRGSKPVSTVLRKSVRFFIRNIFLIIIVELSKLKSGKWSTGTNVFRALDRNRGKGTFARPLASLEACSLGPSFRKSVSTFPRSAPGLVIVETAGSLMPKEIFTAAIYLMFISSLVNPIIYGIMNPLFQAAFKRALNFGRYGNNQISESSAGNRDKP